MSFEKMITWRIIFLCLLPCYQTKDDGIYECGAHGRFEYCIDGIPGCVVGCHCHPGYYFDTESKICEPNTKLTQNYRRYIPEPTRIQNQVNLPEMENTEMPTLTTRDVIDDHVNDITKNADDLGDWLYNQFFKTIENQVINNTKDGQLTRRSGSRSYGKRKKSKRRAKKRSKSRHRKRKGKGMRQKLLQITEDDSLFESSDSYESESDSSSSDYSGSYSSYESDSFEGHGHKKIVMINKKPRPPLPSFIFLPHMNTPFFPPIGLPPPPAMPMYPVVPVPPVMPVPPMPFPGPGPDCQENTTVITTIPTVITTTITTTTEESSSTTDSDVTPEEAAPDAEEEPSKDVQAYRNRNRGKKRKQMKSFQNMPNDNQDSPYNKFKSPRQGRHKLMQNLRQKINNPRINNPTFKRNKNLLDNYPHMLPDNLMDNINPDDVFMKNENSLLGNVQDEPDPDSVDFKYLSQLIHRVNESQNEDLPMDFYNPQDSYKTLNPNGWSAKKKYRDYSVPLQSGRRMIQNMNNPREVQPDDTYYSNLGRQIATLIRTIDVDNERQLKIEIEKVQQKPDNPAFFADNAPRTFWERSVRSPLKYFYPYKNRHDYLKNSNELLFNIENKVETVVSTVPTLSLQEIENMISVMQSAQKQFRKKSKFNNIKQSSKTLNINLWPQEIKQSKNSIKSSARSNVLNINKRKFINYSNNTRPEILNSKLNIIKVHNTHTSPDQANVLNLKDVSTSGLQMQPVLKTAGANFYFIRNNTKIAHSEPLSKQNGLKIQTFEKLSYNINPTANEYRNIKKYFFDDSIHYSFQNDNLPLQYSPVRDINRQPIKPLLPSPYFNDETNPGNFTP